MKYLNINDAYYTHFGVNNTSGSGDDGASAVYDVRLAGAAASAAPVMSGNCTLLTHANYPAGAYEVEIAVTVANGFAANSTYAVFCTLAVDGQNPTGKVGEFQTRPVLAGLADNYEHGGPLGSSGATFAMQNVNITANSAHGISITAAGAGKYAVALTDDEGNVIHGNLDGNVLGKLLGGGAGVIGGTGARVETANIVTAAWTALLASSDFSTVASIGKLLKDFVDAAVSSRLATAGYTAPPSAAAIGAQVTSDHGAGSYQTATGFATINPDNTGIAAIKVQTDKMTFNPAGVIVCNINYVNDIEVDGTGTTGDPWGPV